jgi:hypothetical protein
MGSSLSNQRQYVVRVFSNYDIGDREKTRFLACSNPTCESLKFEFNKGGVADLVLVLNFPKVPMLVKAPRNAIVKILQEPVVKSFWTHRFTYKHSRLYSTVLSHSPSEIDDERLRLDHPHLPMHVDLTMQNSHKTDILSIISSKLAVLPGHKRRDAAVTGYLEANPALASHAFGRGRLEIQDKSEGLARFMYSVAVENDQSERYFTEKILDCFEHLTVPIYFGAPDIKNYFPELSVIEIDTLDSDGIERAAQRCSAEDYQLRLPALMEARALARRYSRLCCAAGEIRSQLEFSEAPKKRKLIATLDTFLTFFQRSMVQCLKLFGVYNLALNAASTLRKFRAQQ